VPTHARVRAVQLAQAAMYLAQGAGIWPTPHVLTPTAWARRAFERAAERDPGHWPRILGAAEEWLLWREAAQEAARGLPIPDVELLAESLQRSDERAATYGLTPWTMQRGTEAELHAQARQLFAARCRERSAASVSALFPRLAALAGSDAPLLRGFDSIAPALAALGSSPPRRAEEGATAPRGLWTADSQAQHEAIAAWCCEKLRADPAARLLVILPGA